MKKKNLFALLIGALLSLTSCSLFNDDDLAFKNEYHPKQQEDTTTGKTIINGVIGVESPKVEDCLVFKDVYYANSEGKIVNSYKTGAYSEFNVNNGKDYEGDPDVNNYDLYIPNSAKKDGKNLVMLFIHGGAWVGGFKTDMNPYVQEFASRGYITATIKYTLLDQEALKNQELTDEGANQYKSLSIFRDLDEIDACIASIKSNLGSVGFDTSKIQLAIGGGSSGSHLTMLYSYSRGESSPIPINFIVNVVGPTDIKPAVWKRFIKIDKDDNGTNEVLDNGLSKEAIAAEFADSNITELGVSMEGVSFNWNDYQTMRIANGMCGFPQNPSVVRAASTDEETISDTSNAAYQLMTKANGGQDLLSVTHYITEENRIPIICAYAGKDSVVGINQYATLQKALEDAGYTAANHKYVYFQNSNHTNITAKDNPEKYSELLGYINDFAEAAVD